MSHKKLTLAQYRADLINPTTQAQLDFIIARLKFSRCSRGVLIRECTTAGYQASMTRRLLNMLAVYEIITLTTQAVWPVTTLVELAGGAQS